MTKFEFELERCTNIIEHLLEIDGIDKYPSTLTHAKHGDSFELLLYDEVETFNTIIDKESFRTGNIIVTTTIKEADKSKLDTAIRCVKIEVIKTPIIITHVIFINNSALIARVSMVLFDKISRDVSGLNSIPNCELIYPETEPRTITFSNPTKSIDAVDTGKMKDYELNLLRYLGKNVANATSSPKVKKVDTRSMLERALDEARHQDYLESISYDGILESSRTASEALEKMREVCDTRHSLNLDQ